MDPPFSIWIHPATRQLEKYWQFWHVPDFICCSGHFDPLSGGLFLVFSHSYSDPIDLFVAPGQPFTIVFLCRFSKNKL
jgi:hypothetical protein